jgi:hypothetical protein
MATPLRGFRASIAPLSVHAWALRATERRPTAVNPLFRSPSAVIRARPARRRREVFPTFSPLIPKPHLLLFDRERSHDCLHLDRRDGRLESRQQLEFQQPRRPAQGERHRDHQRNRARLHRHDRHRGRREIPDREQRQRDRRRYRLADPQQGLHPQRWNFHSRLGRDAVGRHDESHGRNLRLPRRHAERRDLRRRARSVGVRCFCPPRQRHGGEQRRRHGRGDDQRHRR